MSESQRPHERPDDSAELLEAISPGLTSRALAEAAKTAESLETIRFCFNPWVPIPNISLQSFGFGVQIPLLKRMELIPLKTWKTPVIIPRTNGWALGSISPGPSGMAFPSGSVGSRIDHRLQFPLESVENLLTAFGSMSPVNTGFVELVSLKADTDVAKVEALAIFKAIMQTRPDGDNARRGDETLLEDLIRFDPEDRRSKFLEDVAPALLAQAMSKGVVLGGKRITLPETSIGKGEAFIEEMKMSIYAATVAAMKILEITKSDLADAKIGVKDVKRKLDMLDKWLLQQFYSFSMDSEVERAARATAPLGDAIRQGNFSIEQLVEMQARTLAQLEKSQETNSQLTAHILSQQSPPPASSEAAPA